MKTIPGRCSQKFRFCLLGITFFAICLLANISVNAQATFTAAASGAWTTPATWTFSGTDADGVPDGDDTVSIPNTRVVTVTGAQTVRSVNVNAGGTLTINAASTLSLSGTPTSAYTNSGTTDGTGSVIIQGTASFNIDGTFTAPLVIGAGTTTASSSSIGGSLTIQNGATLNSTNQTVNISGNLTVDAGALMTKTSGVINANGANIVNNGTINGPLSFGGGSQTYSGTGVFTATFSIPNPTVLTLGSSVTLGDGATATSLSIPTGGTLALGGQTITINQGALSSSAGTISGAGVVRLQGTSSMNAGPNVTSAIEINSGTTAASSSTMGGSLTISNGATLNISNQTIAVTGDFTNNGTLTNGVASTGTLLNNGANIINNGTVDIGTFRFNGVGIQNFSGSGSFIGDTTLNVINGSIATLASNITFGDGVSPSNFTLNTGGTFSLGSFDLILNNVSMSGSGSTNGTGSIRFQGSSALTPSASYTAPFVIESGTTNGGGGTVGGSFTVLSGATYSLSNQSVTINGDLTVDSGGTITRTSGTLSAAGINIVNNGTIAGGTFNFFRSGIQNFSGTGVMTGSVVVLNGAVATLASDITIGNGIAASALTVNTGGTFAVGGFTLTLNGVSVSGSGAYTSAGSGVIKTQGTSSIDVGAAFTGSLLIDSGTTTASSSTLGGSLTVNTGATLNSTNQTITVLGDLTVNTGGTMTKTSGNINANGPNVLNNGTITGGTFVFGRSGAQTLSGSGTTAASATILNGAVVTLGSNHQLTTLAVNTGGTFATSTFMAFLSGAGTALNGAGTMANVNVTYNGTAAQTVQTANVSYNQLGIDNPAGVSLSAAESVATQLILTNGIFSNGANLTLADNATIARGNGTLASSPTFSESINIIYFGSNPIATGNEIPPSNTIANLTNNNINTVSLTNNLTVNGNATLASGSTLSGGATALTFNGTTFSNNGTESVPTTTFSGGAQSIAGAGTWTGGVFQLTGASNTSLASNVTFSNGSFSVGSGTTFATGGNLLTFNGTTFSNTGTITGAVRTAGANVGLNAGASGFNASVNVNSGTTNGQGTVNSTLTVDATATALTVPAAQTFTVIGNATTAAPLSGSGTFRINGATFINNAGVSVSSFVFGGGAQSLGGTGSFTGTTATILSGSTTTLIVDKQMGGVAINTGGTFNITDRTLLLSNAGTALSGSGIFTVTGSTVEYNGSAAQALAGFTPYNNLNVNNTAGVTGFTGLTVNELLRVKAGTFTSSSTYKDVQIDNGATLAGTNGTTINVNGNWVNNGAFAANGNTVNFNGGGAQSIGGSSATTFNNLTVANAGSGVSLGLNTTVNGILTLTNDLETGANALTMPASGTSAGLGDVIGNVKRTGFTGGGPALSFGNPFNSIAFATGSTLPTEVTINLTKTQPSGFANAVTRSYAITQTGARGTESAEGQVGFSATVRLHYLDTELNSNTEATLKLFRFGSTWDEVGVSLSDATDNWVEQTGITQFSPWAISSMGLPTPTATNTSTDTPTPTATATETFTPTATATETSTPTATATETFTPTATATETFTPTPTATETFTPTSTATATDTPTNTPTSTATATDTPTPTPTAPIAISGAVTYGNAVGSPAFRPVEDVLISGAGSPDISTMTNPGGTYALTGFGSGSYTVTPTKTGGVNGAISSFDAAKIAQHSSGAELLTGNQLLVADITGNGSITSFDAALVASYAVSNPPFGSAGSWKFLPVGRTYASVTTDVTGEDYSALLMGDVSGDWGVSAGRGTNGPERNAAIAAPQLATPANEVVLIPVTVVGAAGKGIISYEFELRYDPMVIQPQADPVGVAGTASREMAFAVNASEPGLLRVAVYGPIAINKNGVLLNLRFRAVGAASWVSPLIWQRVMFNEGDPEVLMTNGQVELLPSK